MKIWNGHRSVENPEKNQDQIFFPSNLFFVTEKIEKYLALNCVW